MHKKISYKWALIVLTVIHLVGLIGMLSPLKEYILPLSGLNLLVSFFLLLQFETINQKLSKWLFYTVFLTIIIEAIGVGTGKIFGVYEYGSSLGPKIFDVPLIIGVNWAMLALASYGVLKKFELNKWIHIAGAASIMMLLDMLIEPMVSKLDFWTWQNNEIPAQNFFAWFGVAFAFIFFLHRISNNQESNKLALPLLLTQAMFFITLNLFFK